MNIETAKLIHEKYNMYKQNEEKIEKISSQINQLSNEKLNLLHEQDELESYLQWLQPNINPTDGTNDDEEYLEMGSPFHKKLEATLTECRIDRQELKLYLDISSLKFMTKGQARKILDNIGVYHDAIEHMEGRQGR